MTHVLLRARQLGTDMARTIKKKTSVKKITRKPWTKDDIRELKALAKQKVGTARIAKKLKRTPGAISVYAFNLGVSLSTR
jgi:hypothetical protein